MTLVAAYDFDEGTGTTVTDASGNGNTGTVSNTTWIVADKSESKFNGSVDNTPSKPGGKYGNALVFNGTSSVVTVPNSSSLQLTTGMTLEAWVNPSVITNVWRDVIYKGDDNYFLEGTSNTTGSPPAAGGTFGSSNVFTAGMSALPVNTWTHLTETYDGSTLRLYINGIQVSSRSQTGNILTSTYPLQIGGDSLYGQNFQGMIDEVRIYDTALTQAQIQTDMNTPIGYVPPPDTTPPTAPTNLIATVISGSQINLSWTASTDNVGVNGYLVYRQDASGLNFIDNRAVFNGSMFTHIGCPSGTTFSDTNLTANSTYSYRVRAMDAAGNRSTYSNVVTATTQTLDTTPPTAPTSLTATTMSASDIDLAWTASTDNVGVTGYLIEREDPGSSSFSQIGTSSGTTFNDTNLTSSSTYSYRVRATDAANNLSSYSNTASATTSSSGTVTTYTMTGPSSGEVATASSNFTVTLGTGTVSGTIHISFAASNSDGTFSPTVLNLTNTTRSGTFTYTPNLWGSRTISATNNGGLTNPSSLTYVSKIQTGSTGTAPGGDHSMNFGGYSWFTQGAEWQELARNITSDSVSPYSTTLMGQLSGSIISNFWPSTNFSGNSMYGLPYNVVPESQTFLPFTIPPSNYSSDDDPTSGPWFVGQSEEYWYSSSGTPPTLSQIQDGNDHHVLTAIRDETTGGVKYLYEYYNMYSSDGGSTWVATGGGHWDMTTGAPRAEGDTSSDVAGLPVMPLLIQYDEVASNTMNHCLRTTTAPGYISNYFVWPAKHHAYGTQSNPFTGFPMGTRFRLKESWYNTNRNNFTPLMRTIIDCLRNYGLIMADISVGGIALQGTVDDRWVLSDIQSLQTIPNSAFEVIDTIKYTVIISGPSSGVHGTAYSFTATHQISQDTNFGANFYIEHSTDGGANWTFGNTILIDDTHRTVNFSWTPPNAGSYLLRLYSTYKTYDGWIINQPTFTAS